MWNLYVSVTVNHVSKICRKDTSLLEICPLWHHRWACRPKCVRDRSVYQPTQWTVANVTANQPTPGGMSWEGPLNIRRLCVAPPPARFILQRVPMETPALVDTTVSTFIANKLTHCKGQAQCWTLCSSTSTDPDLFQFILVLTSYSFGGTSLWFEARFLPHGWLAASGSS
jgi:hypothetical protein